MDATAVMDRLSELGVVATATGDKLLLEPGSKVPPDLLVQVKEHKVEILTTLQRQSDNLLTRLQAGTKWLTHQHEQWLSNAPTAVNDERFSASLNLWWAIEQTVRQVYGYEGCVLGPGEHCPESAPVTCDSCMAQSP